MKILKNYLGGYKNDPVMAALKEYGSIGALPKPYSLKDLGDALSKAATI